MTPMSLASHMQMAYIEAFTSWSWNFCEFELSKDPLNMGIMAMVEYTGKVENGWCYFGMHSPSKLQTRGRNSFCCLSLTTLPAPKYVSDTRIPHAPTPITLPTRNVHMSWAVHSLCLFFGPCAWKTTGHTALQETHPMRTKNLERTRWPRSNPGCWLAVISGVRGSSQLPAHCCDWNRLRIASGSATTCNNGLLTPMVCIKTKQDAAYEHECPNLISHIRIVGMRLW